MSLLFLVSLVAAASPDAGVVSVTRSHQTRALQVEGAQFKLSVDTEKYSSAGHDFAIDVVTITLPDGGTTPVMARLNDGFRSQYAHEDVTPSAEALRTANSPLHRDLEARLRANRGDGFFGLEVSAPMARGPFVQLDFCVTFSGAYPTLECTPQRANVDTGATWSWRALIAPAKQRAFLSECTKRLAAAAKLEKARLKKLDATLWEDEALKQFDRRCDDDSLRDFAVQPDGALNFTFYRGPHVSGGHVFGLTFSHADLRLWVDPKGPLGAPK